MVDQDGGIEQEQHLTDPATLGSPLFSDPRRRIFVPLMSTVDRSGRGADEVGAPPFLERPTDRRPYEFAAAAVAGDAVDLRHQVVIQLYVHTHTHKIAHERERARLLTS